MAIDALPKTWTAEVLTYADLNAAFAHLRNQSNSKCLFLADASQTVSATVTFSASQNFSAGISLTGSLTMATAASKIVPGATSLSLRNNADSADNLIILDSGAATFRSTLTVTGTITGTLATAAQTNITSLGSLTALTIAGDLTFSGASRKLIPGTTSLIVRNVGDTAAAITVSATSAQLGGAGINALVGATALATNATSGFPIMSATTDTPTGVTSEGAFILDSAHNKLWISYGSGTWKYVALS